MLNWAVRRRDEIVAARHVDKLVDVARREWDAIIDKLATGSRTG
jgi:hypothetical protein